MRRGTDTQTDTQDTHTAVANIHFASAMPHTKCNQSHASIIGTRTGSKHQKEDQLP